MQFSTITFAIMACTVSGFLLTDCSDGVQTNFGDGKCQIWTAADSSYSSDGGCTLSLWSLGNCEGEVLETGQQNTCLTVPFGAPISAICE